jgi:type II secretory pathway component PulF
MVNIPTMAIEERHMTTREIKAKINKRADQIESGVAMAAESLTNGADALGEQSDELQDNLREIGRNLLESTKALTDEAARQARLRPLAVFGIAFVAGVIVARALRR